MAKKIVPPEETAAADLAVLFPDSTLKLGGEEITVHEYTLSEQLRYRRQLKPLIAAFGDLLKSAPEGVGPAVDDILDVMADHHEAVVQLMAVSCNQTPQWVAALNGDDSENLWLTWWGVNAGFFTRNTLRPLLETLNRNMQQSLTGAASSAPSSTTDTVSAS
ncbi:DUF6631 family protein [Brenneria populi subsp. brevivirga]|uniref:DUF6631 family protein n=1 Tax=Brenneria populi TaxID=1505588 RepID=UPI002E182BB1|nr:DUF6631 family protein [Brenneria populi subsp. brevivirga]